MIYDVAFPIAQGIVNHLRDYTGRIEIAGSLRREKQDVGDIEIICIPKVQKVDSHVSLFGVAEKKEVNLLDKRLNELVRTEAFRLPIEKRKTPFGPRYTNLSSIKGRP